MAPGSCDAHERIKVLDGDGIDVAVLYHTIIVQTQSEWKDADLSAAYARAYNRWIADFCEPYPDRLIPIPHLSMLDVELAVSELQRVAGLGARAVNIGMEAPEGRPYGDSLYDPFWAEAQESGLPVTIHPHDSVKAPGVIQGYYKITYSDTYWWHLTTAVLDMPLAVASLFQGGVFEKFPGLKIVILESGCGWLPWWLDRMDEKFEIAGFTTGCKRPPSEYFKEQCWISLDPDEHFAPAVISHVGADRFIWASDYPHADGVPDPVNELRKTLGGIAGGRPAQGVGREREWVIRVVGEVHPHPSWRAYGSPQRVFDPSPLTPKAHLRPVERPLRNCFVGARDTLTVQTGDMGNSCSGR